MFCGSTPGRNAAPLNLHRERERERKRKDPAPISTDEGRAGPQRERTPGRTRGRTADPPPIFQAANGTKAPSASTPDSTSRAASARTPPTADTDGPREDRQTDTEHREEPATPGPREAPGQHRQQQSNSNGHGHHAAPAGPSPPVIRRKKNGNGRKSRKAPGHLASPFLPSEKRLEDVQTSEGLFERITLYTE